MQECQWFSPFGSRLPRESQVKIENTEAVTSHQQSIEDDRFFRKWGGKRRKHKNPAVSSAPSLPLPRLPDHLIGGPSCDGKENEAKRPIDHPHVWKKVDPDQCDRLMGINSVDLSSEEDRFGDGGLTDTENPISRVANDSGTPVDSHSGIGSCPGAAESSRGFSNASLAEILDRMPRLMPLLPAHLRVQLGS